MQFVATNHIENLLKDAKKLGSALQSGDVAKVLESLQHHEYFTIAAVEGRMKAEGVSVTQDGEFLCVMIDTGQKQPLSWVRQNLNHFTSPDDDLGLVCDTLESVRQAFVAHMASNMKIAA